MRALRLTPMLWTSTSAVVAFVLGYVGYRASLPGEMGTSDAVYRSLQLFVMDSQLDSNASWELTIARFLAPLALATAALVAAITFLRNHWDRLVVALAFRHHAVLIGGSTTNLSLANALLDLEMRVVLIEPDEPNATLVGLRSRGARVVVGDGRDESVLLRARIDRARHAIVATGNDTTNLDVADQVRKVRSGATHQRMSVHVSIGDPRLWLEVGRLTFGRSESGTTVECFCRVDRTASRVVDLAAAVSGLTHTRILGDGAFAERIRAHIERRASDLAPATAPEADEAPVSIIVAREENCLAEAIALTREHPDADVFVALATETTDTLLELLGTASSRLHIVTDNSASLASDFLQESALELMARAKHRDYVDQERAKGVGPEQNASVVAWDELPESLRESNRRFAASVAETLDLMGARLEPLRTRDPHFTLAPHVLEQLSIREHDRWERDLRADGWTYGLAPKDPIAKTHPLLVPWDQLDEAEREKDRDAIRAIPDMLARAGFTISVRAS